jgi:hypothetical protein
VILCRCAIGYSDDAGFGGEGRSPSGLQESPSSAAEPPSTWGSATQASAQVWRGVEKQRTAQNALRARDAAVEKRFAEGIDGYTGASGDYQGMNYWLRTGRHQNADATTGDSILQRRRAEARARIEERVRNMRALFTHEGEHGVLQSDALLFRGISNAGKLEPGSVITDKAFMSTSTDPSWAARLASKSEAASDQVTLRVHTPQGTKYVTPTRNPYVEEHEVILEPGTRYLVVGENTEHAAVSIDGFKTRTYDVIVLRPGENAEDILRALR